MKIRGWPEADKAFDQCGFGAGIQHDEIARLHQQRIFVGLAEINHFDGPIQFDLIPHMNKHTVIDQRGIQCGKHMFGMIGGLAEPGRQQFGIGGQYCTQAAQAHAIRQILDTGQPRIESPVGEHQPIAVELR